MLWWLAAQTIIISGLCLLIYILWQRQKRFYTAHQQRFEKQQQIFQQFEQSHSEIEELRAGIIGVGQRLLAAESRQQQLVAQLLELQEKQQALELAEPEAKIYSRAMKMVQLGADLDEIMRECELPKAEAELLFTLHQQRK